MRSGLQLSWFDRRLVAWHPAVGAGGANLRPEVQRVVGAQAGRSRLIRLVCPDAGGELRPAQVMVHDVDSSAFVAAAGRGAFDAPDEPAAPGVRWFAAVTAAAMQLVAAGRIAPHLSDDGRQARWLPLATDRAQLAADLAAHMPPVVTAAVVDPGADAAAIAATAVETAGAALDEFVDTVARAALAEARWRVDPTAGLTGTRSTRHTMLRTMRLVGAALTQPGGALPPHPYGDLDESLGRLGDAFERIARRADGEPVLSARLRLDVPDHADAPWPLRLELVDDADGSRWCTAPEVTHGGAGARALAGTTDTARALEAMRAEVGRALTALAATVPWLGDWFDTGGDGTIDLDRVAQVLVATADLDRVGVALITPERLVRRRPELRGTARPAPAAGRHDDTGSGRFGARALVDWQMVVDGVPVDAETLRRAAESAAALVEIGGRWVQIDQRDALNALHNLAHHQRERGEVDALELLLLADELDRAQRRSRTSASDARHGPADEVDRTLDTRALSGSGWVGHLLEGLPEQAAHLAEAPEPAGFAATLRPYQRRGLAWMQFLHELGLGGCLADDMGLGKTPTTLAHLATLPGPHLVVCPLSVVRNWEREAARFVPTMRVAVHHGAGRADAERFAAEVARHDLVITTYQTATRDIDTLVAVNWRCVVVDEAQAVKNPDTRTARALRRLPARQHLALTGTPVENRLAELWSIMALVTPGLLGGRTEFRERFAGPIERHHDEEATAELRRLIAPFVLRRTKADRRLVPDLPPKVEQIAWAPLTREQATMYQQVVDTLLRDAAQETGMRRRGLVLAALTRLKQICNHPAHALADGSRLDGRSGKLARFDELVTDLLDAGERALVFTQFREMGRLLQRHLAERFDLSVPFLHGGVPMAARTRLVDDFQTADDTSSPLLLVSLKAGGTGLNLTAASRVVHYDRWWNPAVEDQATDRAWRIGQQRSVFVHALVCQGTVEEKIGALIDDKRRLADAVVGASAGEGWLTELSDEELYRLIVLSPEARGE